MCEAQGGRVLEHLGEDFESGPTSGRLPRRPEPRDVIWENVWVPRGATAKRRWVVNAGLSVLMIFWSVVVSFCSSSSDLGHRLFDLDPESKLARGLASVLPVVALLSILNILPLIFQLLARFYERLKAHSEVDLSVVERFFRFQFVNVYVSIFLSAILSDLNRAWKNPFNFVVRIGFSTPNASFYFAKLLVFQCGSSPLWLLRSWPLISRGWKTWTVQAAPKSPSWRDETRSG